MEIDIKFAEYLNRKGLLEPLIDSYKEWRDKENYPFQLKDKQIMFQSVFRALCDFWSSQGFNKEIDINLITQQAKEIVEEISKEYGLNTREEISNDVIERIEKLKNNEEKNKN
jgi:hypothetical protein